MLLSSRDYARTVRGRPRRRGGENGELILVEEELSSIPALDLRDALRTWWRLGGADEVEALVSALPEERFDEDGPVKMGGFELAQLFGLRRNVEGHQHRQ